MYKKICPAAIIASMLFLSACDLDSPEYNADFLVPLVKTQFRVEDIDEIVDPQFELVTVIRNDVSTSIIPSNIAVVPSFSGQLLRPYVFEDTENSFRRAKVDTANFKLDITNNFPINIKAGTEIVITNTVSATPPNTNPDTIFKQVLTQPIMPGEKRTLNIALSSTTPWIDNDLRMYLRNFGSDGSNGQTVNFTGATIELVFRIDVIHINEIEIFPGKEYTLDDTISVEIGETDENTSTIEQGTLTLYLKNGFPANFNFTGQFLDQNYQVVDDQLTTTVIASPTILSSGYVNSESAKEEKVVTTHTQQSWKNLSDRTRYMRIFGQFNVPSNGDPAFPAGLDVIRLRHTDQIPLQLVSDVKVKVTP